MKKLLLIFTLLLSFLGKAQTFHCIDTKFIGGNIGNTQCFIEYGTQQSCIPTKDKGVLLCGITNDSGSGDIPPNNCTINNPNSIITKLDSNGTISWVKVFGNSINHSYALAACQVNNGGYAVLINSDTLQGEIFLYRLDNSGNLIWKKHYGQAQQQIGIDILQTQDDGFLIFGTSDDSSADVPLTHTPVGSIFKYADWILIKTDSVGNKQWVKVFGTSGDEPSNGKLITDGSAYYICNETDSKDYDCADTIDHPGLTNYVLKIDTSGNLLWSKAVGTGSTKGAFFDDRDSSILVTGGGYNFAEFTGNHGDADIFLFKINKQGSLKWTKQYGDTNEDWGSVIIKGENNGYILGAFTFLLSTAWQMPNNHIGLTDIWLFLVDSLGNEVSNKIFGGIDHDYISNIIPYKKCYGIVGSTRSNSFTEGTGIKSHTDGFFNFFFSELQLWPQGVENIETVNTEFAVYPNPSSGKINIEWLGKHKKGIIQVNNSEGKLILNNNVLSNTNNMEIDMNMYLKGVYLISWISNKQTQTTKLIVQ